jgi:hypothetical protein
VTNTRSRLIAVVLFASILLAAIQYAFGQSEKEIQSKLDDLRSDDIPHNCESATKWFLKNREKLKERLGEEFYKAKDPQARDAIFHVLFNTSSFAPDARFVAAVLARLPQEDKFVGNRDIFTGPSEGPDRLCADGAHWEAWKFINDHFEVFEPKLKEQVGKTDSVFVLWGTAWLLKKHGLLQDNIALFTPAVLAKAVENLKSDNIWYNASQAVRLFLLLGDSSLPALHAAAKSPDNQTSSLAKATIDALGGNHKAFGYLGSKVLLEVTPFGPEVKPPDWQDAMIDLYLDRDTYP